MSKSAAKWPNFRKDAKWQHRKDHLTQFKKYMIKQWDYKITK